MEFFLIFHLFTFSIFHENVTMSHVTCHIKGHFQRVFPSIPLYGIGVAGALVVLEGVGEGGCVAAEGEVVAGVG